jgi:sugar/nucleoside kinase (ribokinase family)
MHARRVSASAVDLLILGHVTRDELDGEVRLGGAASFAARAAATLGIEAWVVTGAPPESPLLAELRALPHVALHVVPDAAITTFALDYGGPRRILRLLAVARPLRVEDLPAAARAARVAYVGGVAGECGRDVVEALDRSFVVAGLQGWLRRRGDGGLVEPALAPEACEPPRGVRAASLSEEDHPDAARLAAAYAGRGVTTAVTRGAAGATIYPAEAAPFSIPAAPAAERDPTGAGDVFALVFGLALAGGAEPRRAGALAAEAAAHVVEGPGIGALARFDRRALAPYLDARRR